MLIPSVISIAIAIAGSIGLSSFLNSANEEKESSAGKNALMVVAFATVVVVVIKLIVKLIYGNEEIKERPSTAAKQCKSKKSKNKLKQKKISESEEASDIVRQIEHCNLGAEVQEELKEEGEEFSITSNIDKQEVIDQETSIVDEGWIDVEKKERRKKSHHSRQNRISSAENASDVQSAASRFFVANQSLRDTPSVRSIRKDVEKEDKEMRGGGG